MSMETTRAWRRRSGAQAPRGAARGSADSTVAGDRDDDAPAADLVDDGASDPRGERGAAEASPEPPVLPPELLGGVVRGMNDDVPLARLVVDALVEAVEAQRIAVRAVVRLGGAKDAEAGT